MKIIIQCFNSGYENHCSYFHNIIKRFEEDLKNRIPTIKKFEFTIKEHKQFNVTNILWSHSLDEEEENLYVNYSYRNFQSIESVESELIMQLKNLLKIYR